MSTKVKKDFYEMSISDLKILESVAISKSKLQPHKQKEWLSFSVNIHHLILLKAEVLFNANDGEVFEETI